MKKYLESNIALIFKIFLYLQPVVDIITGIMLNCFNIYFTFAMIIRFIFLLFIIIYYLFIKKNTSKYKRNYLVIILLFIISYSIITIYLKNNNALFNEISQVFKILYFPILLTMIDIKDIKVNYNDFVKVGLIYLILIAFANVFNIANNSYTQGKIGSVGLFYSGNEISAIISILTPFFINYLFDKNSIIYKLLIVMLIVYTYFNMGSKIVIISLILSIIFNIYLYLTNNRKINKNKIIMIISILVLLVVISLLYLPHTNIYYNLKLHLNYLGINSFNDIFSYTFINRFIFSDRLSFLYDAYDLFIKSPILLRLFGMGTIINDSVYKFIEMDLFDVLYITGLFGFILFIIPLIKSIKDNYKNKDMLYKYSIIVCLIISILVGHTLIAPGVSIYFIYLISGKKG